jgi:hypothetical protein
MNANDTELESWRALWLEDARPLPDVRTIVAAGRRRLMRRVVLDCVMAAGWIGIAIALIRLRPEPALLVLGGGILVFVAVASAFSIWNTAGVWSPEGESVRDFLEVAVERCRRDLRAVRFGLWFSAVELVLLVAWLAWTSGHDVLPEISRLSDGWLVLPVAAPVAVVAWLLAWRRRARAELAALDEARRALEDERVP